MNRTFTLSILVLASTALLPLAAAGKIAPDRKPAVESDQPSYKYEAFAGYGYTSLNQVNTSRYGLQGVDLSITRDWGKFFGLTADGAYYKYPLQLGNSYGGGNPGNPSVDSVLLGPVVHSSIFGKTSGFFELLLGGEHTGGNNQTTKISTAGGFGCGLDYKVGKRIFLRASGGDIASSFSVINPTVGDSPHRRWNSRASFGVVFKY